LLSLLPLLRSAIGTTRRTESPAGAYSLVSVLVGEDHAHRRWLGSAVEGDMAAYLVVEHTILDLSKFEEYRTKVGSVPGESTAERLVPGRSLHPEKLCLPSRS
jgi:hypothetical protein